MEVTQTTPATESRRYEGRPLVRLLELYVLWSIGELSVDDEARLEVLTPELRETYDLEGSWHEIVARVVELDERLPAALASLWRRRRDEAVAAGTTVESEAFARRIVDENFG